MWNVFLFVFFFFNHNHIAQSVACPAILGTTASLRFFESYRKNDVFTWCPITFCCSFCCCPSSVSWTVAPYQLCPLQLLLLPPKSTNRNPSEFIFEMNFSIWWMEIVLNIPPRHCHIRHRHRSLGPHNRSALAVHVCRRGRFLRLVWMWRGHTEIPIRAVQRAFRRLSVQQLEFWQPHSTIALPPVQIEWHQLIDVKQMVSKVLSVFAFSVYVLCLTNLNDIVFVFFGCVAK